MTIEGWRDLRPGAVVNQPGSTINVDTGSWAVERPVVHLERCTHCMICWIMCPDMCFHVEDFKIVGVDYDHCKGCGICVQECPRKCIDMVEGLPESSVR